ncbi:uncharacterized protein V1513DRAFT_459690 [Lipomyces chichibuensis]|uniref:uncharacterized protein n=1 Tax=Lipomyces chichibuensis TaxID=1546026 RepID=UPI003343EE86
MDPPTRHRRKQSPMANILSATDQSSIASSFDLGHKDSIGQIASRSSSTALPAEVHNLEFSTIRTASNIFQRNLGSLNNLQHCQKWSIKDSARSTSTTNVSQHRENGTQPTIMTWWKQSRLQTLQNCLKRI